MTRMFRAWVQGFAESAPSCCAICHAWPARPVCDACAQRFAQPRPRCRRCALATSPDVAECGRCVQEPGELDGCHAAVSYDFPWASLIGRFKFRGEADWAAALALLMRSAPWFEPALEAADLVLPMPLAPARLRERGFNQALELARRLAPAKVDARLLLRVRDTQPQSALDRRQRVRNVRDAFAVEPLRAAVVAGRSVALVDDVMTSGASLQSAAKALRQAGARRITALVLARTEQD